MTPDRMTTTRPRAPLQRQQARRHDGLVVTHLDEPSRADEFADVSGIKLWQLLLDDVTAGTTTTVPDR